MYTARLFQSGGSQAVRLPKEYRFAGTEVVVKHFGNGVLLLPVDDPWQMLAAGLAAFGPTGPAGYQQPCLLRKQARALSDDAVASLRRLCALSMALLAPAVFYGARQSFRKMKNFLDCRAVHLSLAERNRVRPSSARPEYVFQPASCHQE
jgi:antitoxin VapB